MVVKSFESEGGLILELKTLLLDNKIKKAVKILDICNKNEFSKLEFALLAVDVYRKNNDLRKSLGLGRQIIKLWPDIPSGYQRVIQDYLRINCTKKAVALSRKAIQKFPNDPGLLMLASNSYRSKGLLKLALKYSKMLVNCHNNNPVGHYLCSQLFLELGNMEKAKKFVKKLLEINQSELSFTLARQFYRAAGLRQKAKHMSLKLLEDFPLVKKNQKEYAIDLLILGKQQQFFDFCKKNNLFKCPDEINFFTDIFSLNFALNLKEPLDIKWKSHSLKFNLYNHYIDPTFNQNPHQLLIGHSRIPWICIIHVGKCAGETVINSFRQMFPRLRTRILEYHVFDSNFLISKLIKISQYKSNIEIIICTRDPLARWISSFNWDYYTYKLRKHQFCPSKVLKLFDEYPTNKSLADGLLQSDPKAKYLMTYRHFTFGHMAMGQSWYINCNLINDLPTMQTSVIRTEFIEKDIINTFQKIHQKYNLGAIKSKNLSISRAKQNVKNSYSKEAFTFLADLTISEIDIVVEYIKDDFDVHNKLVDKFSD